MTETNAGSETYEFGDFRLEPSRRLLTRLDGRRVELAGKAFDALMYLVAHAGAPVARSELVATLWPRTIVEDNSLSKLIVALRRALGEDDDHRYIATLPGRGYQFVTEVRRVQTPAVGERAGSTARPQEPRRTPVRARRPGLAFATLLLLAAAGAGTTIAWLSQSPADIEAAHPSAPLGMPVPTQLTAYAGYELAPTLSQDGASVAFSWDGQGNRDLYVTRIGGAGQLRLTDTPESDGFPAWSPTGADIAFLRQTGPESFDLMLIPAAGGPERAIRAIRVRPTSVWGSPLLTWTPRGDAIVFTTRSGDDVASPHHLYRLTIASGETVQLTTGDDTYDTSPAISVDGRWLAFVRHDGSIVHARGTLIVQSLAADAGAQQPIVVPVPSSGGGGTPAYVIHSPSWSQDGRYLTFVLGNDLHEWEFGAQSTRLVYAGAGRLGGLTAAGDLGALTMVRDADRARAVFASVERSTDIFALPLEPRTHEAIGPPAASFESSAGEIHPHFSPDGRRVAFVSTRDGRLNVWVAQADGGDLKRVTDLQSPIVGVPRWSPDGKLIAFHARDGEVRQIYLVNPDAGLPRRIAPGCCAEWSKDGSYLYVTDLGAEPVVSRIRVADGEREPLFPGAFPSLTADGATLLYTKVGEKNLYARAVDDLRNSPEEVLLTDAAYPSGTAATADGFFYLAYRAASEPGQIRFYDHATRQTRLVARTPAGMGEILSVSPDGLKLLYSAQRESGADLWLLDFDGSETDSSPRQR